MVNFFLPETSPYKLQSVRKQYTVDQDKGTHPRVTFRNTERLLRENFPQKQFRLIDINEQEGFYSYDYTDGLISQHGKGATKDQAKASAIMEFSERFSWVNYDYKNACNGYIKDSFNNLKQQYDIEHYYRSFTTLTDNQESLDIFTSTKLDWVKAYSLTKNKYTLYPISWNNNFQTSNGLATGNSKEEAIVQGICEVIERHNVSIFIRGYKEMGITEIDIETIKSEVVLGLINILQSNNIEIHILNVGQDVAVPTFIAMAIDHKPKKEIVRIGFGYGCHTDPEKAIIRAITEYVQGREGHLKSNDISATIRPKLGNWQFNLSLDYEYILANVNKIKLEELPNLGLDDFRDEVNCLVEILRLKDIDVVLIDKTHPLLKIPVYRIFTPGLYDHSGFSTISRQVTGSTAQTLFQAGLVEEANKYFRKHFAEFNQEMSVLRDFIAEIVGENYKLNAMGISILKTKLSAVDFAGQMGVDALFAEDFQKQILASREFLNKDNKSMGMMQEIIKNIKI